jgi:energy-coupling factor transport system ATP-binding protein
MDARKIVLEGPPQEVFRHASFLEDIGLEVLVRVQERLRAQGLSIEEKILDERELVNRLCQS